MTLSDPNTQPRPAGGWSEEIVELDGAVVVPPTDSGFVQAAGVLDADGGYCAHGALWRKYRPITTEPPAPAEPPETLPGRWIWGGVLWSHFGHFLAESTARLWALDAVEGKIDGVIFVPKRPRLAGALTGFHAAYFALAGLEAPVRSTGTPLRVEKLVVPGQGFGLGEISEGTEAFRTNIRRRFGAKVAPEGPEKLYVSRSALGLSRGSILGELYLEERLAEEGYEIFHPQQHPMEVQIARYKAAKQVVAADGSALHLYAMVGGPDQAVAIVARRKSSAVDLLARNVAHFCGRPPVTVFAIRRTWYDTARKRLKRLALGELNLEELGARLTETGFVEKGGAWKSLPLNDISEQLRQTGRHYEALGPRPKFRTGAKAG